VQEQAGLFLDHGVLVVNTIANGAAADAGLHAGM